MRTRPVGSVEVGTRRAFTLVETVVGLCLAFVVLASAWTLLGAGMRGERAVSYMAAAKGARILREALRRDLARVDLSRGAEAFCAADEGFVLHVAAPAAGASAAGRPALACAQRRYRFVPDGRGLLRVWRDGRPLAGVLLTRLRFRIVGWRHLRWLEVELQSTDPGLAGGSGAVDRSRIALHDTGLLLHLPHGTQDPAFIDYSASPPSPTTAD